MKAKKRVVKEAHGDWSTLRQPSPYRIGRAPAPRFNADEQMKMSYLMQSAEQVNNFLQKNMLAGRLESIDPLVRDFFKQFAHIFHYLDEQLNDPTLPKEVKKDIINLQNHFDKIGTRIASKIIPLIDKLTTAPVPDEQIEADLSSVSPAMYQNIINK